MAAKRSLKKNFKSPTSPTSDLVEVVDEFDQPIAVLPLQEVHRQRLRHRSVMVLLYNLQGKVFLQKRSQRKILYPGRWDISATGHVQSGESSEDAALRELREELGVVVDSLKLIHQVKPGPDTDWESVSLYSAGKINQQLNPAPQELDGGYFLDDQELEGLVTSFRDLLTPGLVFFWERGLIFPSHTL